MSELKVLSVASEIFPLVKTGGLADVAGALPGALAREGVEMRTLVPGYPAVMAKLADAATAHEYADLFGGPARVVAGKAADSTCSRSTRRISSTGRATPISAPTGSTGPTMRAGSRRWDGSAPTSGSARSTPSGRKSFTPMTGRRRSLPPICTTRTDRVPARRSPSTTSPSRATFRPRSSPNWACPRVR